jgi:alpha-glucosidase
VSGEFSALLGRAPFWDLDGVHDIFRRWRAIADGYPGDRVLIGEIVVDSDARLARYVRPGGLHQAFNFSFLKAPWEAPVLRARIDSMLGALAATGAPATWVLSNHDEVRHLTRYARADTAAYLPGSPVDGEADVALGTRRARAAALLMLALPGGAYVYQGEELGLWEVEDLPEHQLHDPVWRRSGGTVRGRDGSRVPLPWSGAEPPFGFGPEGAWLPQPAAWRGLTVAAQRDDPGSMLALYRRALALRRTFAGAGFAWNAGPAEVLDFSRGDVRCVVNLSRRACAVPGSVLLTSVPLDGDALPPDTAVWTAVA